MARNAATVDIGINVPASEIRKAEQQLGALFNKAQAFNKNPIVSKNYTQPLGRITGAANEFNKSLAASNARVIAFGASAGAIFAVQKAMSELVKTTIQVEQQLKNIEVLLGATDKEFRRFSDGLFKTAQATGKSFADVAASAEEFARQGLNVEATLKRNNAAMVLSKLGAMDVKNATESLTAAINTFGKSAGDATTIVNKLAQVDAKFAVSSGDLAEAIKRSGAAAVSANVEFEQFISVVTLAQERTARGGAVIGNSFKTIFTRLQRNETLRELEKLGVATRNLSTGELLPAMTILKNYAKVYETLAPTVKASTAQMLAGVFQVNVLKSVLPELANEYGRYNQALNVANSTTNEATERMKELTSTTQGMLNKTMVNLTKFASEVGNLTIKPALERILKLMNGFADLIGPENFFGLGETIGTAVYKGMGKIIEGPGLLLLGVVIAKIAGRLGGYVKDAAAGFMGIQTQSQRLADTQSIIQNLLANRPKLINQATASEEGMVAVARVLAQKLKESSMEMERLTLAAQRAAPAVLAMQGGAKSAGGKKIGAKGFVPGFASGFVPNFNMATQERRMASAGGYQAGKIKEATLPGVGRVTYNGNEKIKQFPGLEQPGIMPPALSPAGKNYRESFRSVHGFDPYNSAGGFVPNFAAQSYMIGGKQYSGQQVYAMLKPNRKKPREFTAEQAAAAGYKPSGTSPAQRAAGVTRQNYTTGKDVKKRDPAHTHPFDVGGRIGILSFDGARNYTSNASMFIRDISAMNEVVAMNPALANDKIQFTNVPVSSVKHLQHEAGTGGNKFFEKISDFLARPLADLTQYFSNSILGNQGKLNTDAITRQLKGKNALLPPGAEGDIFESVVKILTTDPQHLRGAFDANRNFKAPFDFEEVGQATPKFKKVFFPGAATRLERADAKKSGTQDQIDTIVKKGINWALLNPSRSFAKAMMDAPGMSKDSAITPKGAGGKAGYHTADTRTTAAIRVGNLGKALGFVPNFAAAGSRMGSREAMKQSQATVEAVQREEQAGVARNKIRVGFDKRIKGGVGVFNTDEGSLRGAIDMHIARGATMQEIQRMGAAGGFIPNFASQTGGASGGGGKDSLSETSMGMSMALMMVGSQLSVFGDTLQESDSSAKKVTGEFLSLAGAAAMYYPAIHMMTSGMGGVSGAIGKVVGHLKNFGAAAMASMTALYANAKAATANSMAQGANALGGGMMFGQAGRLGMGSGFNKARGSFMAGFKSKRNTSALGSDFLGKVRGGAMNMGSRVGGAAGMAGRGGAALLGGGAATVAGGAALAYGGYKIYQAINDADFGDVSKKLSESLNAAKDKAQKFGEALGKAGDILGELDAEQRRGGDTTQLRQQLVGSLSGSAFADMIGQQPGGSLSVPGVGDGSLSRAEILKIMGDENTSSEARNEIMTAATKLKDRYAKATDNVEGINSVIDTIKENQGFWRSTAMTAEDVTKMGGALASVFSEVSSGTAKGLLPELEKVENAFSDLDKHAVISTGDLRNATDKLGDFLNQAPIEAKTRKQLVAKLKELTNTTNLSEDDLHDFYKKVLPHVRTELEGLAESSKFVGNNLNATPIRKLHDAVVGITQEFDALSRQLTFNKSLQDIFQDETVKMFDLATKTLQTELGKTASDLTKIQVTTEIANQRAEIKSADRMRKIQEGSQKQLMDVVRKIVQPKTSSTEAQAGVFPDYDTFKTIVGDSLSNDMQKAIRNADFAGAQQIITNALQNQQTLTTAGQGISGGAPLTELLEDARRNLQNMQAIEEDKFKIEKEKLASEKRFIDEQEKASKRLMALNQAINFGGGLAGAGGAPEAALRRVGTARFNMQQGLGGAGRDVFMKGLIDQVKIMKSLTDPGGRNPANAMVPIVQKEIKQNLQTFLQGSGIDSSALDLDKIAKAQAEALIRPDKSLIDIADQNERFKFDGDALQVKVVNFPGQPEGPKGTTQETVQESKVIAEQNRQITFGGNVAKRLRDSAKENQKKLDALPALPEPTKPKGYIPKQSRPTLDPLTGMLALPKAPETAFKGSIQQTGQDPTGGTITVEILSPSGKVKLGTATFDTKTGKLISHKMVKGSKIGVPQTASEITLPPTQESLDLYNNRGPIPMAKPQAINLAQLMGIGTGGIGQPKPKGPSIGAPPDEVFRHRVESERYDKELENYERRRNERQRLQSNIDAQTGAAQKKEAEVAKLKKAQTDQAATRVSEASSYVTGLINNQLYGGASGAGSFAEAAGQDIGFEAQMQQALDKAMLDKQVTPEELEGIKQLGTQLTGQLNQQIQFRRNEAEVANAFSVPGQEEALGFIGAAKAQTFRPTDAQATSVAEKASIVSFNKLKDATIQLIQANEGFPPSAEIVEKGLIALQKKLYGTEKATKRFEKLSPDEKFKKVSHELRLLSNAANMEALREGQKSLEEVRPQILETIKTLTGEGKGKIKVQLKQLKELENQRIKDAAATRKASQSTKFMQEASDSIIQVADDFSAVGLESDKVTARLQKLRNRLAKGGMSAEEMQKFADEVEKVGMKAKKAKRDLGLMSPDEYITEFLKVWNAGLKNTTEVAAKALKELYEGIGDVKIDPTKRKKELSKKFGELIGNSVKDMSSGMEGESMSIAHEYFQLTKDQAGATKRLNNLDKTRRKIFKQLANGTITETEAKQKFAQATRKATDETDKLARELNVIDAKEFKERFVEKIQAGLQDGSVTLDKGMRKIFTKIGDIAMDAELREKEIKKGLGKSITNAIAGISSDAIAENTNIGTELYKVTGDLGAAQNQAIDLDKKRVDLFKKLRKGSITLAQALEQMSEAQDKARKNIDVQKRQRGQMSEAEFIQAETQRFEKALQRSGTDLGASLNQYFNDIIDLDGSFFKQKGRENSARSAKAVAAVLNKTVTDATNKAYDFGTEIAAFESGGPFSMWKKTAEEASKIRAQQFQVEAQFAKGLISRVEADKRLDAISREATDKVTKLAMAVNKLGEEAGKSKLLENRMKDIRDAGGLTDPIRKRLREEQNKVIDNETLIKTGQMVGRREADIRANASKAEDELVKRRFEQTGSLNEANQLALQLEKQRTEIIAEGNEKNLSAIEIERQLASARLDTSAKNLANDLKNGSITADQYRQSIGALSEDLMNGSLEAADKTKVWKMELGALFALDKNYGFKQLVAGTKDVFMTLREGIKGALKDVITGAKSMREALQGVFAAIADKMLDRTIGSLVDTIFYALMPRPYGMYNKGGQVKGYNGGGIVRGGSGVRDDVPAVLTRGEYVVRKKAVNKYGRGFIEQLNQGRIKKYADGGSASFNLMNQFDYDDPKRPTAGTMNVDSRMSALAQTDTNNPMNQLKFDKEKTLDSYLKEKAQYEEQKRQAMANYRKQRKGLIRSMFIQIAMLGVQHGINTAIAKAQGAKQGLTPKGAGFDSGTPAGTTVVDTGGGNMVAYATPEAALQAHPNLATNQMVTANPVQMDRFGRQFQSYSRPIRQGGLDFGGGHNAVGHGSPTQLPYDGARNFRDARDNFGFTGTRRQYRALRPVGRSKGGPMMGGRDNIPALLTGGEYVVNKQSVGKYGLDFFNKLNAGKLPGFNSGGLVGENNGSTRMTDGGGAPSNVNNNITINVTVEKDGNVNTDTTNEQAGGNQNTQGALNEEERNKQFSGAIKDAVVREIVEQKRPGGLLYNEKRSGT